jgi:hypothetical protein
MPRRCCCGICVLERDCTEAEALRLTIPAGFECNVGDNCSCDGIQGDYDLVHVGGGRYLYLESDNAECTTTFPVVITTHYNLLIYTQMFCADRSYCEEERGTWCAPGIVVVELQTGVTPGLGNRISWWFQGDNYCFRIRTRPTSYELPFFLQDCIPPQLPIFECGPYLRNSYPEQVSWVAV